MTKQLVFLIFFYQKKKKANRRYKREISVWCDRGEICRVPTFLQPLRVAQVASDTQHKHVGFRTADSYGTL